MLFPTSVVMKSCIFWVPRFAMINLISKSISFSLNESNASMFHSHFARDNKVLNSPDLMATIIHHYPRTTLP